MTRQLVIFDASPKNEPQPWMVAAAKRAKLRLVDIAEVAKVMSQDEQAKAALLASGKAGEDPALAPHYAKALEKVAGADHRVAVHSVSWILYGQQPLAVVLDFDRLQDERAEGKRHGLTDAQYDALVADAKKKIEDRVGALPKDRVLRLPAGLSDDEKAAKAAEFVAARLAPSA